MLRDFLLEEKLPLFWCPGCGNGVVLQSVLRNIDKQGWTKENTVVATGIGCWGKADDYVTTNSFHGTHGRALAYATGIKLGNQDLNVLALMGDGDGITIGGNHLIHAARRNIDITAIMVNNLNYGMTGGQYSGTTPINSITKTSPYGHVEQGFDVCSVVKAAGASFVARGTVYDIVQLNSLIDKAMKHKGFSFVEVISNCHIHYGRSNKMPTPVALLNWIKENTIAYKRDMDLERVGKNKIVTGIFADRDQEDYGTLYDRVIEKAERM